MGGILLYNALIIRKQAERLISQQVINANDLVLISIGGNDLRNIVSEISTPKNRMKALKQIVRDIEITLYMLANNGARKILLMSAPNMSLVTEFNNKEINKETNKIIGSYSEMLNQKTGEIIKNINNHYQNSTKKCSLYDNMPSLFEEFKKIRANGNVTINYRVSTSPSIGFFTRQISANPNPNVPEDANSDDYFFFDQLHPS